MFPSHYKCLIGILRRHISELLCLLFAQFQHMLHWVWLAIFSNGCRFDHAHVMKLINQIDQFDCFVLFLFLGHSFERIGFGRWFRVASDRVDPEKLKIVKQYYSSLS